LLGVKLRDEGNGKTQGVTTVEELVGEGPPS